MSAVNPPEFRPPIDCFLQAQIDAQTATQSKKKSIFVFCDGTGNEFTADPNAENANSNVVKLYTTVRIADHQVAYYHPGVGTMGDPGARHWITRKWSMIKGLAFAAGFKDNIFDAYRYLMSTYSDGDNIYLFGFSRGAYTARALAGLLHGYGLLCPGNEGHLPYAWKAFAGQLQERRKLLKKTRKERADLRSKQTTELRTGKRKRQPLDEHTISTEDAFLQTFSRPVTIRFMGIWDTVSSVGWIYEPLRLLDMAQNPIIQVGRHAVSIDERRAFYRDNLWGPPLPGQDIVQVWFPGVHSDVGGSYSQQTSGPANVALEWMIDELIANGAELCGERINMVLGQRSGHYVADDIYCPAPAWDHCLHESLTWRWRALQFFPQEYYDKDEEQILWRVPLGTPRSIPAGAILHESAVHRIFNPPPTEPSYLPRNIVSPQQSLTPLVATAFTTAANLQGCYQYDPPPASVPSRLKRRLLTAVWGVAVAAVITGILSVLLLVLIDLFFLTPFWAYWGLHDFVWLWALVLGCVVGVIVIRYKLSG